LILANMTDEDPIDLSQRLAEIERRLQEILALASSEVIPAVTPEQKLEDVELRLNRIYDLAKGEDITPDR
jgi:hypothetical protein